MPKNQNYTPFTSGQLEKIAQILGRTEDGLTGSEIGQTLKKAKIEDIDPSNTKWMRIYNAFADRQNKTQNGNCVLNFIHYALEPALYIGRNDIFEKRREEINSVLLFTGLQFNQDGKFQRVEIAHTINEAEKRASRLRNKLKDREVHKDVLKFCKAELLQDNYFHAVLEAVKSISAKIRRISGIDTDGAELADAVFGGSVPILHINGFQTKSQRSEQAGFVNILKGIFGLFRNPTAHEPRVEWEMSEEDALDLLVLASYVHRRIDKSN